MLNNTSEIISLPSIPRGTTLHFGSTSTYERFIGSYFINKNWEKSNDEYIYKDIITNIEYNTDTVYSNTGGNYWVITVQNTEHNTILYYYIRNFGDIVTYYEGKDFVFINSTVNLQ